ncbi:Oidioi.mRNA.OKI2018_I69.chr2.g5542.t2.cds [Oikopleura dioica]|uniref:Oidioi.mRNA.OKI2018_I69.chr2.g5542.t2.cds n=1 Tax=Oikopleura dioica TaxID=34765 RepID=A0ABN7T0C4_OIKDI|nr:Oidioi.mRNA.OKI2018_I69.chr2.g5542.t2.cds [Oikopleura dioica]
MHCYVQGTRRRVTTIVIVGGCLWAVLLVGFVVEVGLYETMCQHSPDMFSVSCQLSGDLISYVCYSLFIFTAIVVGIQLLKTASNTPPAARNFKSPLALKKDKLCKQIASSTALVRLIILIIAALVLLYIVQKTKELFPQLLNGFEPADHPKLAILNVFMYVLNNLALLGVIFFASQELTKLNQSIVDPMGTARKKMAAENEKDLVEAESPPPQASSFFRLNRHTDHIQIIRSSTKQSLQKTPESHSSSTSGIGSCSPSSSSPGSGSTPPPSQNNAPSSKRSQPRA